MGYHHNGGKGETEETVTIMQESKTASQPGPNTRSKVEKE
jgi:hypothetical protein